MLKASNFPKDCPPPAQQMLLTAVMQGNSLRTAAKLARIPYQKLVTYLQYAEDTLNSPQFFHDDYSSEELQLFEFFESLQAKQAEAEVDLVLNIKQAADRDWKAAAHILRVRNPEDWSEKPQNSNSSSSPYSQNKQSSSLASLISAPNVDLRRLSSDELILLEQLLLKATVDPSTQHGDVVENRPEPAAAIPDKHVLPASSSSSSSSSSPYRVALNGK